MNRPFYRKLAVFSAIAAVVNGLLAGCGGGNSQSLLPAYVPITQKAYNQANNLDQQLGLMATQLKLIMDNSDVVKKINDLPNDRQLVVTLAPDKDDANRLAVTYQLAEKDVNNPEKVVFSIGDGQFPAVPFAGFDGSNVIPKDKPLLTARNNESQQGKQDGDARISNLDGCLNNNTYQQSYFASLVGNLLATDKVDFSKLSVGKTYPPIGWIDPRDDKNPSSYTLRSKSLPIPAPN